VLLSYQPLDQQGRLQSNRDLLFPTPDEVSRYEHNLPHTENRYTGKPYTEDADAKQRQQPFTHCLPQMGPLTLRDCAHPHPTKHWS
jgi:hypothetical protein